MVGTFLKLPATEAVDIAALAGFDFAIVDREHSQLGAGDALRLVRHAAAVGLPAVVRVAGRDPAAINRLLEAGGPRNPLLGGPGGGAEILSAGLDVVFIGLTDLTVDLEFDAERGRQRVEEITKATEAAGLVLGAFAADAGSILGGARYVAVSSDLAMLRAAAAGTVADAR